MEENIEKTSPKEDESQIPESPKPLAFTIDFGEGKSVDTERQKKFVEKYQKRHRRGQSLSKLEDAPTNSAARKHPLSGNLPRKASFQSEGYFSSDEKSERNKNVRASVNNLKLRDNLSLPLKNVTSDKMTQSFPNYNLPCINSPEIELKDVSSPELDLVSPFSPRISEKGTPTTVTKHKVLRQFSSPECEARKAVIETEFVEGAEFEFDKSDTASDAGTYTLDAENYSEEQKARMSIDREFKIEQMSVQKKTEEYIQSLSEVNETISKFKVEVDHMTQNIKNIHSQRKEDSSPHLLQSPVQDLPKTVVSSHKTQRNSVQNYEQKTKMLSPILSPTQNISITQNVHEEKEKMNNSDLNNRTLNKILFPSPKARNGNGLEQLADQGSIISVTSSGAFRPKNEKIRPKRQVNLTQTEVQVEAYNPENIVHATFTINKSSTTKLTANIIHVGESIPEKNNELTNVDCNSDVGMVQASLCVGKKSNLPPAVGGLSGKMSPTKIPSPVHTVSRPRSRNSVNSLNVDLSDSSLETESYLKPTQNYINSLQQRLSLDSDNENEFNTKYLNNDTRNLLKQKPTHTRHNSFDDRSLKSNKLEHFQNKNLLIDQTYTNVLNQYQNKKIQNSPNNSPIKRSSSFSTKNQINIQTKCSNLNTNKESNIRNSPNFTRNSSIQRSASTANIKPNVTQYRRSSASSEHKIDRNQFGDTESSSEEDYEKNLKKKDITNTRYNRAFSLRRARLDTEPPPQQKCPNTPEMRRKFQPNERAVSVDRKPAKTVEIQSRYLLNISRNRNTPPPPKIEVPKNVPKNVSNPIKSASKMQVFSRTDSGRFSVRSSNKPPSAQNPPKKTRKDGSGNVFFCSNNFANCPVLVTVRFTSCVIFFLYVNRAINFNSTTGLRAYFAYEEAFKTDARI